MKNVLVVGGGLTGLTAAIALAQRDVAVTLIERAPAWSRVGHGLTVQGNALRVLQQLDVLDEVLARGFAEDGVTLRHADGGLISHLTTPRTGGPGVPATLGVLRADLHEILVDQAQESGVRFRLGTEMLTFDHQDASTSVRCSDGTTESWDLVIAAEGIKSSTRAKLGIRADRAPSGLGIWRALTDRRPDMRGAIGFPSSDDGGAYKVGYTVISKTQCYIFVLCRPQRVANGLPDWQEMQRLMANFHGEFDYLRESLTAETFLNFQEIEWLFVDEEPWHVRRVLALGEAVHAVPPLIAQGAAQCLEDSLLLGDYVTRDGDLDTLLTQFEQRRKDRVRGVVDASLQLAHWELHPGTPDADPGRVMHDALAALVVEP